MEHIYEGLKSWGVGKLKITGDVVGDQVRAKIHQAANELAKTHVPEVKKAAKKFLIGVGGVSLLGSGAGSYLGTRVGNKKKKIKESIPMLFSFAIGVNSALREKAPNYLVQESIGGVIKKLLGMNNHAKSVAKIKGVLPASKLGKAMYSNPKAMEQAFRLYGSKSKTIKKAIPTAFGKV